MRKHLSMLLIIIVVLGLSIGYSAYNQELMISGDAVVRVYAEIRVTNVRLMEMSNGAGERYTSNYSKNNIQLFVNLPANSSITYEVEITNESEYDYYLSALEFNEDVNIEYEISSKIYDTYYRNNIQSFQVKLTNTGSREQQINFSMNIDFIRDEEPTIALNNLEASITKGDAYEIVKQYTTGPSGGEVFCITSFGENIQNTSDITQTGEQEITCTVVTNTGRSISDSVNTIITYDPYSSTNLLVNGDFSDGTNGWMLMSGTFEITDGIVISTIDAFNDWQTLFGTPYSIINDTNYSHQFYLKARAKVASGAYSFGFGETMGGNRVYGVGNINYQKDEFTESSTIITPSNILSTTSGYFAAYHSKPTTSTETSQYDYFMVIDLTETFGVGNEPSQEWCDRHISYFDGTTTIYK